MLRFVNTTRLLVAVFTIVAISMIGAARLQADTLNGAGSTFIDPIMKLWAKAYADQGGSQINYQAVGSGTGISSLINQTVDFAGSDVPMTSSEASQVKGGVIHIPDILGSVAVCYNVPGVGPGIHLSGPVLADIFEGKITYWDDAKIKALSPGVAFPHENILVVHRSDGSGTTAIFTDYLSKVSASWKNDVGSGKSVNWPVGLGGKGSPGVAGFLKNKPYSIGYVELAYAITNVIYYAAIENRSGAFVYPYEESATTNAAVGEPVAANLEMSITNTGNAKGYPISGYSYLIVPAHSQKAAELKRFIMWVVTKGQEAEFTGPGHYAPIPPAVAAKAQAILTKM